MRWQRVGRPIWPCGSSKDGWCLDDASLDSDQFYPSLPCYYAALWIFFISWIIYAIRPPFNVIDDGYVGAKYLNFSVFVSLWAANFRSWHRRGTAEIIAHQQTTGLKIMLESIWNCFSLLCLYSQMLSKRSQATFLNLWFADAFDSTQYLLQRWKLVYDKPRPALLER